MLYPRKTRISLACLIVTAGCDQASLPTSATAKTTKEPIAADVDQMEAAVRITAANKRIDELERQVGELQATPEKLDLELLTRRVAALEAGDQGSTANTGMPVGKSTPAPDQTSRPLSGPSEIRQGKQNTSNVRSPEIETKSRVATADEAKAFNRAK